MEIMILIIKINNYNSMEGLEIYINKNGLFLCTFYWISNFLFLFKNNNNKLIC